MNDDEDISSPTDPITSFVLEDTTDAGPRLALRFHDPGSMEVVAELRFRDPAHLVATAETAMASARVLATSRIHGFGVALEVHGLSVAIEPPDLSQVDLTVDDILDAGPAGD